MFKPKTTLKKTRVKLYNTLAVLTIFGCETWQIKFTEAKRITAVKIKQAICEEQHGIIGLTKSQIYKQLKNKKNVQRNFMNKLQDPWVEHVN